LGPKTDPSHNFSLGTKLSL